MLNANTSSKQTFEIRENQARCQLNHNSLNFCRRTAIVCFKRGSWAQAVVLFHLIIVTEVTIELCVHLNLKFSLYLVKTDCSFIILFLIFYYGYVSVLIQLVIEVELSSMQLTIRPAVPV